MFIFSESLIFELAFLKSILNLKTNLLAYAVRFCIDEIVLYYPNTINDHQKNESQLSITYTLANNQEIEIRSYQLPIINKKLFTDSQDSNISIKDLFETTRQKLITAIENTFI